MNVDLQFLRRVGSDRQPEPEAYDGDHDCDGCRVARARFRAFRPLWFGNGFTYVPILLCVWCFGDVAQEDRAVKYVTKRGYVRSAVGT